VTGAPRAFLRIAAATKRACRALGLAEGAEMASEALAAATARRGVGPRSGGGGVCGAGRAAMSGLFEIPGGVIAPGLGAGADDPAPVSSLSDLPGGGRQPAPGLFGVLAERYEGS